MKRKQLISDLIRISNFYKNISLNVSFNDGCPYLNLNCSVIDALLLVQYLPYKFTYSYKVID